MRFAHLIIVKHFPRKLKITIELVLHLTHCSCVIHIFGTRTCSADSVFTTGNPKESAVCCFSKQHNSSVRPSELSWNATKCLRVGGGRGGSSLSAAATCWKNHGTTGAVYNRVLTAAACWGRGDVDADPRMNSSAETRAPPSRTCVSRAAPAVPHFIQQAAVGSTLALVRMRSAGAVLRKFASPTVEHLGRAGDVGVPGTWESFWLWVLQACCCPPFR